MDKIEEEQNEEKVSFDVEDDEESYDLIPEYPMNRNDVTAEVVSSMNMRQFYGVFSKELNKTNNASDGSKHDNFKEVQDTLGVIIKGFETLQNQCANVIDEVD